MREDGRKNDELRKIEITKDYMKNAHGSVLISVGNTQVICSVMIEQGVPPFMVNTRNGWLTAEYAMLPASTLKRKQREKMRTDGRSVEIQRLIGRALRSVCDFSAMGEYTFFVDCDVLSADGGTRTASITGAFVALKLCVLYAIENCLIEKSPIKHNIAAVSAGIVKNTPMVDLCYTEDSSAMADMNLVACDDGSICEVQISGEKRTVTEREFAQLMILCQKSIEKIIKIQNEVFK